MRVRATLCGRPCLLASYQGRAETPAFTSIGNPTWVVINLLGSTTLPYGGWRKIKLNPEQREFESGKYNQLSVAFLNAFITASANQPKTATDKTIKITAEKAK